MAASLTRSKSSSRSPNLLFIRRLDEPHTLEHREAARGSRPTWRRIFPEAAHARGHPYQDLRWSRVKHMAAGMLTVVGKHVFPSRAPWVATAPPKPATMRDPRFTILTPPYSPASRTCWTACR